MQKNKLEKHLICKKWDDLEKEGKQSFFDILQKLE